MKQSFLFLSVVFKKNSLFKQLAAAAAATQDSGYIMTFIKIGILAPKKYFWASQKLKA